MVGKARIERACIKSTIIQIWSRPMVCSVIYSHISSMRNRTTRVVSVNGKMRRNSADMCREELQSVQGSAFCSLSFEFVPVVLVPYFDLCWS